MCRHLGTCYGRGKTAPGLGRSAFEAVTSLCRRLRRADTAERGIGLHVRLNRKRCVHAAQRRAVQGPLGRTQIPCAVHCLRPAPRCRWSLLVLERLHSTNMPCHSGASPRSDRSPPRFRELGLLVGLLVLFVAGGAVWVRPAAAQPSGQPTVAQPVQIRVKPVSAPVAPGQRSALRAFDRGRFHGQHAGFASAEMRYVFTKVTMFGFPMAMVMSGYVDVGQVFGETDQFLNDDLNVNPGGSIRFVNYPNVGYVLNVAHGQDGMNVTGGISLPF